MIDRRIFIQGAALLSTSGLLFYSADALGFAPPTVGPPASQTAAETDVNLVFKVDGWDPVEHPPMLPELAGEEVFIQVNRAWRTAWR